MYKMQNSVINVRKKATEAENWKLWVQECHVPS